ncbi:MAG: Ldh family oxidoreductase [Hyphomicrobiaceae bacterium]|nr:Ldh family oxidoreductase [Hyphomicrobiaceae bacterium]
MSRATPGTSQVTVEGLQSLIARALSQAGASEENAAIVARALTAAEVDGQKGHGLSRVTSYIGQLRSGKVDGHAVPSVRPVRPAVLAVDAALGFAYPALDAAVERLPALARDNGIAAAGIYRSHHAGALGLVVERLATAGLVALMLANTPSAMAAWGGRRPLLGTNPVAFAAPRGSGEQPLVIDLALSEVARGKILSAAQKDEPIPEGWALDREGNPTTDARAALEGTLLPAGGAKGAALALMVELLAAGLTGGRFAAEASSFLDAQGSPPSTGQLLIAIDPTAIDDLAPQRIGALCAAIEAELDVRLPGSRRRLLRERAAREGVTVEARLLAQVQALASS